MILVLSTVLVLELFELCGALGEQCTLANGSDGYIRALEDCPEMNRLEPSELSVGTVCCPNSGKSYEKCLEYGKYVYREDYGAALLPKKVPQNISECSIQAVSLVVGGNRTVPKEFPHMVAIGFGTSLTTASWMCGGTLISENFVVTAAHCSSSRDRGPANWARLGDLNLQRTDDEANVQEFRIIERILHPRFKPPSRYNDIALFRLSGMVEFDGFARPACLNVLPELEMRKAMATGWGKLEYGASNGSADLMKVTLSIIKYEDCNATFRADIEGIALTQGVQESQLCAGELQGGKDTCQGDSGGPLQVVLEDPYCMYSIIGITSFGKFCGFKNSPAVYTKVSHYIPWIESVVWP